MRSTNAIHLRGRAAHGLSAIYHPMPARACCGCLSRIRWRRCATLAAGICRATLRVSMTAR